MHLLGVLLAASALIAWADAGLGQTPPTAADPELGRDLAERVCSACHLVAPDHAGPVPDGVPTFMSLAERLDDETIETLLIAPTHPVMPVPPLSREERAHVIAHIRSLAEE